MKSLGTVRSFNLLKPQSNGPFYSNTAIGTLSFNKWTITFGTSRQGLGAPFPSSLCNSPPINGQCINFTLFDVAL